MVSMIWPAPDQSWIADGPRETVHCVRPASRSCDGRACGRAKGVSSPVKSLLIRPIEELSEPETVEPAPWAVGSTGSSRSRWAAITLVVAGCLPLMFWHFLGLL